MAVKKEITKVKKTPVRNEPSPPDESSEPKKPLKQILAEQLRETNRIARFKGATIIEEDGLWLDMSSDRFSEACYKRFGDGTNKSRINDLEHLFRTTAPDMSAKAHLISFGGMVWNTKTLDWEGELASSDCVYRVPYQPRNYEGGRDESGRIPFIMDLACQDKGVYDDIMQSVAPLIMDKKPTGVIWYLGNGANGKSTLVHLLYLIFGPYLTELTVKQLEDERDTPQLNGKLGNICKESSEGFVEDTRTYKCIGTHENFGVHKFHSQDMVTIEGNVHHIFSANNIPTFGDKSYGARRRTLVIPFSARFKPDESFEDRTFTPEFIEQFVAEMIVYSKRLAEKQNYEYNFSGTTQDVKEKYDTDANTAQKYMEELVDQDIYGFKSFDYLWRDYENWCAEHGYKPSSLNVLRRAALDDKDFDRKSMRDESQRTFKMYVQKGSTYSEMATVPGRAGLYQSKDSEYVLEAGKIDSATQGTLLEQWSRKGDPQDEPQKQPQTVSAEKPNGIADF